MPTAQTSPRAESAWRKDAVTRIGQHAPKAHARRHDTVEFGKGDLGLAPEGAMLLGHAGLVQASRISRPGLGQE